MNTALIPLKALSEEVRVRLLMLLSEQDACVCELMAVFDMAQSKLSHHLIVLRDAGLVRDQKRGRWNYYRVDAGELTPLNRELLRSLSRWLLQDATIERDRRVLRKVKERMKICC